jgi:hypothetical protein
MPFALTADSAERDIDLGGLMDELLTWSSRHGEPTGPPLAGPMASPGIHRR